MPEPHKPISNGRTDERLHQLERRIANTEQAGERYEKQLWRQDNWAKQHDGWVKARWDQYDKDLEETRHQLSSLRHKVETMTQKVLTAEMQAKLTGRTIAVWVVAANLIMVALGTVAVLLGS